MKFSENFEKWYFLFLRMNSHFFPFFGQSLVPGIFRVGKFSVLVLGFIFKYKLMKERMN